MGEENIFKMLWPIWLIAFVIIIFGIISMFVLEPQKQEACRELGFERFTDKGDFYFCVNIEGNYHFVEWGYDGFLDIYVKEISVGDVRVR